MSKQYPGGLITKTPVTPAGPYQDGSAPGIWTLEEQAYWAKQGLWPTAGLNPTDPYFNYVTALFHGDGTNGAQNNTFLDSSTNNFTITRNGNTTQGTFTPYGSNWSNYFNASASRLEVVNSNSSMIAQGTAFTLESWVFINTSTATGNNYNTSFPFLCSSTSSSSTGNGRLYSFGTTTFGFWDRASASWLTISWTPPIGQWFHLALVSSGTVFTLYINGTSVGSVTDTTTYYADSAYNFYIASYVGNGTAGSPPVPNMYISNFRYTKAQVYTTTFTPSTTPLTAIANTTVLTCQSNRFIDNSSNAYTVNPLGTTTPSVQRFSPFSPTTAYSTSVIGGSGYFDGTGDYLTAPNSTAFDLSTSDFTIEGFFYPTVGSAFQSIFAYASNAGASISDYAFQLLLNSSNGINFRVVASGSSSFTTISTSNTFTLNSWNYVCVTRTGTSVSVYLNGTTTTGTIASTIRNNASSILTLGRDPDGTYSITGYLSNLRILKGTAVTPSIPTAPLTAITNTSLLLNYTNAGILDNAMISDQETVADAQVSTSVKKYGTGSMSFDGTGDRLVSAANPGFAFNTGDFTVEGWIYTNTLSGERGFIQTSDTAGGLKTSYTTGIIINIDVSPYKINCNIGGTGVNSGTTYIAINTWYHVALTRASGSVRLFINGALVGGPTTITTNITGQNMVIGGYYNTSYLWNGYIDDFRITKGYARYTAAFTPPTSAFPNQ